MNRKQKFRYMRDFIGEYKIKDGDIKRGLYGSLFNLPKKVKKALKKAKNRNHEEYMKRIFIKMAEKGKSNEVIKLLAESEGRS